ncbi:hypothetical protein ACH427_04495 [Streptomyces sp. NPDC020379]|uniref:hypothetical protein n=1 Tax=Streptomyces sp. NPDC020379 TaxID=3365071 RepID=UPI0037A61814
MHYHVGTNIPGYLPESEPHCVDSLGDALASLKDELEESRDNWHTNCPAYGSSEWGECTCHWCRFCEEVESTIDKIDTEINAEVYEDSHFGDTFVPPEGAPIHFWLTEAEGTYEECELSQAT